MADDTHDRIPGYLGALTAFGSSVAAVVLAGRARAAAFAIFGASDALRHAYARIRTG